MGSIPREMAARDKPTQCAQAAPESTKRFAARYGASGLPCEGLAKLVSGAANRVFCFAAGYVFISAG